MTRDRRSVDRPPSRVEAVSARASTPNLPVAEPWFDIKEIEAGVHRVTEPHCHRLVRANCYLVKGTEQDLLIDTGMGIGDLRPALASRLDKPLLVFTTHTHVDHIGGHRAFRDCEILVHPREADDLRAPSVPPGLAFDHFEPKARQALKALGIDTDGLMVNAVPAPGYDPAAYVCEGVEPTGLVGEGDTIDLGTRRLSVLHLPGHSPGGVGLWDPAAGTLFSGDALYDGVLIDDIAGSDIPAYVATMRRLRELPVRIVHGGHRDSFERARMLEIIEGYLERRQSASGFAAADP